jgi:hypothetical protein
MNSYDYEKLPESRVALTNILGAGTCANLRGLRMMLTSFPGLLVVEGDKHKQQVRVMLTFWTLES